MGKLAGAQLEMLVALKQEGARVQPHFKAEGPEAPWRASGSAHFQWLMKWHLVSLVIAEDDKVSLCYQAGLLSSSGRMVWPPFRAELPTQCAPLNSSCVWKHLHFWVTQK